MKLIAQDILKLAGIENPKEKFGKVNIIIGGIRVRVPRHLINVQDAKKVDVIVDGKKYIAEIPENLSEVHARNVKVVLEQKGRMSTKKRKTKE